MSLSYSLAAFQTNTCAGPFLTSPSTISKSRDLEMWTISFHSQHTSSLESFCSGQCVLTSNQRRQMCNVDVRLASHTHGLAHSTHSQTDTWQHESTDLPDRSFRNGALCGDGEDGQGEVASESVVDMVTLGNMCVDVFVDVEELPPEEREAKLLYMQKLVEAPPDEVLSERKVQSFWESGGFSNSLIAAARLGLTCSAMGHLGNDKFGEFLLQIMRQEGINFHEFYRGGDPAMSEKLPFNLPEPSTQPPHSNRNCEEENDGAQRGGAFRNDQVTSVVANPVTDLVTSAATNPVTNPYVETLFCWVMIDPAHCHAFCSRFDFDSNPMFASLLRLPPPLETLVRRSKALFINGFIFDEVPTQGIISAARFARDCGAAVFFDPGPRTFVLTRGEAQQREALERVIGVSSVLLLTAEEAEALTGVADPWESAQALLARGGGVVEWVVVKRGALGCVLAAAGGLYTMPGFRVEVADTVGCGDSFAAAIVLGFTRHWEELAVLALANAVGAATAMGQGAGRNVARAETVEQILCALQANENGEVDASKLNSGESGHRAEFGYEPQAGECVNKRMNVSLKEAVEGALHLLRTSLVGTKTRT